MEHHICLLNTILVPALELFVDLRRNAHDITGTISYQFKGRPGGYSTLFLPKHFFQILMIFLGSVHSETMEKAKE